MQYIFHEKAGESYLKIDSDIYKYLFKVRRHKLNEEFFLRNLNDNNLYKYEVISISKRDAEFKLLDSEEKIVKNEKALHIAWCVVDPKTVEKNITSLNEMGVDRISFIYADYSQKNFKINIEKLEKILINSSQQCGRSDLMKLDIYKSLDEFLEEFPNSYALNFSQNRIEDFDEVQRVVIGTEGGFSKREIELFGNNIFGLNSNLILKSETAVSSIASKIIL